MKLASVVTLSLIAFGALASVACGGSSDPEQCRSSDPAKCGPLAGPAEASCGLQTQFSGDDRCILPPAEGDGTQLHIGPADYDNPDDIWIMDPGAETTQCYHVYSPNKETVRYFKQQYRMRPGSHHMIITTSPDTTGPEQWGACRGLVNLTNGVVPIGGTQHVVEDYPPEGKVAPEDIGLAKEVLPHTAFDVQLHFYNTTSNPTLREVWVNLLNIKEEQTGNLGMLGGFAPVSVPPHSSATTGGLCNFESAIPEKSPDEIRVVSLFGHAHTHNQRFAVYHQFADQTSELVYDSYDGAEAPQYVYSTAVDNPTADPVGKRSGGASGQLILRAGESLKFECDIVNNLNITLTGQNEVFTAEMCNLFGSVAGLGFPCFTLR